MTGSPASALKIHCVSRVCDRFWTVYSFIDEREKHSFKDFDQQNFEIAHCVHKTPG